MLRTPAAGQLRGALTRRNFVITAEIAPPLSTDPQDLLHKALPLRGLADAVNVTDAASARASMDSPAAAALLAQNGIEPILQLTCRDRNRIALQGALIGSAAMGVRNVLVLGGDDPKAGDQPESKAVFDLDSSALIATLAGMRDRSELPNGRKISGPTDFFVGAADVPLDPTADWKPIGLLKKIAAGAQFAQTQFCMDAGIVKRYLQRLHDSGVPHDFPMLIGVAPLASARSARWIKEHLFGAIIPDALIERMEHAADQRVEGRNICVEMLHEFMHIKGVAGAHVMAPLNESSIAEVIASFRGSGSDSDSDSDSDSGSDPA